MISNRRQNLIRLLFLGCLLIFCAAELSAREKQVELKWKEVPRASGYLVEIKDEKDKTVIQQKTKNAFFDFSLTEGDYQARISVLNKFQKVAVSSKWFAIRIKISLQPAFISISQSEFMIGREPSEAVITGNDFQKYCRVSFQSEGRTVEAESTGFNTEQSLSIKIDTAKFQPGYYDIIITNPGGNRAVAEKKILFGIMPEFTAVTPDEIKLTDTEAVLEISGDKFDEKCAVSLSQGGAVFQHVKTERVSGSKILVTVNPSGLKEGRYGIIISNTEKFFVRADNALKFFLPAVQPKSPAISSVAPISIFRENKNVDIKIKGSDILRGSTVSLISDGTAVITRELNVVSDTEAVFTINPSRFKDGNYTVQVTNPGNASSKYKKTLEIYTTRGPVGIYIGISPLFNYNYILNNWGNILKDSFKGFDLYTGYDLPFFNNVPVIKDSGIEFNFDIVQYAGEKKDRKKVESELTTVISALGIYYKNNFSLPVDFLFRIGSGLVISKLETQDMAIHSRTSYKSDDPYFYCGPSVRYSFSDFFFAEIGADLQFILYTGNPLNTIHSFLRIGAFF